jgi:tRNA wybutosine-synthesizing protein 1
MFYRINRPRHNDAWERWLKSLHFLADVNTRTVLRMTLIRDYNENPQFVNEFAEIMLQGNPHFVELKSYMHIGMSTQRLKKDSMLEMNEVQKFSNELYKKMSGFSIMDESEISRIVVLQNQKRYIDRWIDIN